MSTLVEIEAAVNQLPTPQQEELYAFLGARLRTRPEKGPSPEEFEVWYKRALGAGLPGITTDEIMAMTRGEE